VWSRCRLVGNYWRAPIPERPAGRHAIAAGRQLRPNGAGRREATLSACTRRPTKRTARSAPLLFTIVVDGTGSFRQAIVSPVVVFAPALAILEITNDVLGGLSFVSETRSRDHPQSSAMHRSDPHRFTCRVPRVRKVPDSFSACHATWSCRRGATGFGVSAGVDLMQRPTPATGADASTRADAPIRADARTRAAADTVGWTPPSKRRSTRLMGWLPGCSANRGSDRSGCTKCQ
jgi:hypothetical protein